MESQLSKINVNFISMSSCNWCFRSPCYSLNQLVDIRVICTVYRGNVAKDRSVIKPRSRQKWKSERENDHKLSFILCFMYQSLHGKWRREKLHVDAKHIHQQMGSWISYSVVLALCVRVCTIIVHDSYFLAANNEAGLRMGIIFLLYRVDDNLSIVQQKFHENCNWLWKKKSEHRAEGKYISIGIN